MDLTYTYDGKSFTGHLADGSGGSPAPGILVFHGGGGLGPHARRRADMLAELGFVAFAPDLFGHPVDGLDHAHVVTGALTRDFTELRARCRTGLDTLLTCPNVDPARLAAIGFCFGGQVAIEFARSGADLRAVVGFHSQLTTVRPDDSAKICGKVLVCLGDRDRFVTAEDREAFMDTMTGHCVDCQLLLFSGVQHGFTDRIAEASGVPGLKYSETADRRSWAAMLRLFDEVFTSRSEGDAA
jgi:dienelactone hydrolase